MKTQIATIKTLSLISFYFIFLSCQTSGKTDNQGKISSQDSVISELNYQGYTFQIISSCIKEELNSEEDIAGTPVCNYQKVAIIHDGIRKYLNIPIPKVEKNNQNGEKVYLREAIIDRLQILEGIKGKIIWLFGEPKCASCPSFNGYYSLSGELLGYKYSKISDEGEVVIISSLNNRKAIFEQYGIELQQSIDITSLSETSLVVDLFNNNSSINKLTSTNSDNCLEGKLYDLPYNSETEGEYSGTLDDKFECQKSIIEFIGDRCYYDLLTNKIGKFSISIFTLSGDNTIKQLCTIQKNKIISSLIVYKHIVDYTVTPIDSTIATFEINADYIITIKEKQYEGEKLINEETKTYKIREDGQIIDLQTNKQVEIGE